MPAKNVVKDNYNMMLLQEYLRERIKDAGFGGFEMAKSPTGTRVTLHVTRPGIVIGRKGVGIKELTDVLGDRFGLKDPQITVSELEKPELSPNVMCNRIATHISRGISFRRATMWTLRQIMDGGAMGVQITVSGKLRGDRSAFEKHTQGILPRAGHTAAMTVSEDIAHVQTPMGLIGVRVRIAKKNALPAEFEHLPETGGKAPSDSGEAAAGDGESAKQSGADPKDAEDGGKPDSNNTAAPGEADPKDAEDGGKPSSDEAASGADPKDAEDGGKPDSNNTAAPGGADLKDAAGEQKPSSESEQINLEAEKMKDVEMHEEEERLQ